MGGLGGRVFAASGVIGVLGLAAAIALGMAEGDGLRHFGFTYLVSYAFFLSISLGAMFFMPIM
jgi:membrane-associated protease RseP (regulator of RpoE activity)